MRKIEDRETTWVFRVAKKIAQRTQITLEENTSFWADRLQTWFYGYKTPDSVKATVWETKVDLDINIAPHGTPTETLPEAVKQSVNLKSFSDDKQSRIKELEEKMAAIKALLPADADEAFENHYWESIDPERFNNYLRQAIVSYDNHDLKLGERCTQVSEPLVAMYDLVHNLSLPDELMRNDTKFYTLLGQLLNVIERLENLAKLNNIELPKQVRELCLFIDSLTDLMIEGYNKQFGIKREMSKEENDRCVKMTSEALFSDKPTNEKLEILEQLWEMPLMDSDDKLVFLAEAIKLLKRGNKRPKPAPCPHDELIRRHLSGIGDYMERLEDCGSAVWHERVAEEMFSSLQTWREGARMPVWTKEMFAEMLSLRSVVISTEEQENGDIDYKLELFFFDKEDSFAGHIIHVQVENEVVREIALMG